MNSGRIFMSVLMLAIFAAMVAVATQYPPQARFMPLVIGIPGLVLCIYQLIVELRARSEPPEVVADGAVARSRAAEERRREVTLWVYFVALITSLILFGFWVTIPVFLTIYLRHAAGESWRFALGLGLAGSGILFLVFHKGLGVVLHGGFITAHLIERLFPS